ncbi:MAG: hypothetical protein HY232_12490 [Acidobacteria bacterium]|nr:hypothetical protein [Acidobacteriota bacterium]
MKKKNSLRSEHLALEQLLAVYYGLEESPPPSHLENCSACAQTYERLAKELYAESMAPASAVATRDEGVWKRQKSRILSRVSAGKSPGFQWRLSSAVPLSMALALVLLIAGLALHRFKAPAPAKAIPALSLAEARDREDNQLLTEIHYLIYYKSTERPTSLAYLLSSEASDTRSTNR